LSLTNVTLATDTWQSTDTTTSNSPRRYYRARLLDFAPDSLAGKTLVATVTNAGPFVVTLVYDASTFRQTGGDPQSGTYSYTKTGPATARINDLTTAPPEFAGSTSETVLTFTSPGAGTFVSQSFRPGGESDTDSGTFLIRESP